MTLNELAKLVKNLCYVLCGRWVKQETFFKLFSNIIYWTCDYAKHLQAIFLHKTINLFHSKLFTESLKKITGREHHDCYTESPALALSSYWVVLVVSYDVPFDTQLKCNFLVKLYIWKIFEKCLLNIWKLGQPLKSIQVFLLPSCVAKIFTKVIRVNNDRCAEEICKVFAITWRPILLFKQLLIHSNLIN